MEKIAVNHHGHNIAERKTKISKIILLDINLFFT